MFDNLDVVLAMLKHGADPNLGSEADGKVESSEVMVYPLQYAAQHDKFEWIMPLLNAGARPDVGTQLPPTASKETVLHWAVKNNHLDIITELLRCGANTNIALSSTKETALHLAAHAGNLSTVKQLLEHGADPNLLFQVLMKV